MIKESNFNKNKKPIMTDTIDANKYQSLKKNHMVQKCQLNTLLGMMITLLLDHCL